jgi:Zn-dependent M32 family carboxypeptidase
MREHVHSRGALVAPEQIARDATGEALGHAAFMRYLRAKYGELYDLG